MSIASAVNVDLADARVVVDALRQLAGSLDLGSAAVDAMVAVERSEDPTALKKALGRLYLILNDTSTARGWSLLGAYVAHQFGVSTG